MTFRKSLLALASLVCVVGFSETALARGGVYIGGIGVGVPGYYAAPYYPAYYAYPAPYAYAPPPYYAPAPAYYAAPAYAYAPVVPYIGGVGVRIR